MPDDTTDEEQALASKANIASVKTKTKKKGLAKEKSCISAKKKDVLSKLMQPPEELTRFLQSDDTFKQVLKVAESEKNAILVRRCGCIISCLGCFSTLDFLQIPHVLFNLHELPAPGGSVKHDGWGAGTIWLSRSGSTTPH